MERIESEVDCRFLGFPLVKGMALRGSKVSVSSIPSVGLRRGVGIGMVFWLVGSVGWVNGAEIRIDRLVVRFVDLALVSASTASSSKLD